MSLYQAFFVIILLTFLTSKVFETFQNILDLAEEHGKVSFAPAKSKHHELVLNSQVIPEEHQGPRLKH